MANAGGGGHVPVRRKGHGRHVLPYVEVTNRPRRWTRLTPIVAVAAPALGLLMLLLSVLVAATAATAAQAPLATNPPAASVAAPPDGAHGDAAANAAVPAPGKRSGEQIYQEMCASCHGPRGEGVPDKFDEPLTGERSIEALAKYIARTMPEDKPGTCTGEDAQAVAAYIHGEFYSPAARQRVRPAKLAFQRLTVRQYRNAVADLFGSFRQEQPASNVEPGGLNGEYFAARRFRPDKRVIERVDPGVDFAFGAGSPDPKIDPEQFAIRWHGSLIAEETGEYEILVRSEIGVRLWLNADDGGNRDRGDTGGGTRSGDEPLVDEWVSSGAEPREHRRRVFLLGGRAYPIRLEVFRFKDKTSSIALKWKPPHGTLRTIPPTNLSPARVAPTLVVATAFPPDDGSDGYERGTSISKAWQQAVTGAAVEAADAAVRQLNQLTDSKPDAPDRQEKLKAFCERLAERAFRRPLTDQERAFFRDKPFEGAKDGESAVKRAVLLVLNSPAFLYPDLPNAAADGADASKVAGYAVASRLALGLWDSIPDRPLLEAAAAGKLASAEDVAAQARRMVDDPRARAKVRDFLHGWLHTERAEDLSKDPHAFPDFNEEVAADLRASLDLFLDAVLWQDERSDYRQLLLANHLYLNERLAKFLGVSFPGSPAAASAPEAGQPATAEPTTAPTTAPASGPSPADVFARVAFDPAQRSGVLTHPYLLAALAYHKHSSPIHRGVFLTRNVVGRTLRPPPDEVQFVDDRFDPKLTMREKVTELTRADNCMGCHAVINPLGFSLENFDAVGRFRTTDNNKPVDTAAEYPTADGSTVRLAGARDVAEFAARSPDAHRVFIRQLFRHVAKQPVEAYGVPAGAAAGVAAGDALENLRQSFATSEYNVRKLLVDVATVSALRPGKSAGPQQARDNASAVGRERSG